MSECLSPSQLELRVNKMSSFPKCLSLNIQIKSIIIYLMEKSTTTVTDAKLVDTGCYSVNSVTQTDIRNLSTIKRYSVLSSAYYIERDTKFLSSLAGSRKL